MSDYINPFTVSSGFTGNNGQTIQQLQHQVNLNSQDVYGPGYDSVGNLLPTTSPTISPSVLNSNIIPGTGPGIVPASTSTPPPAPQQQSKSSGNGFDMKYYPGWNEDAARADWAATGGSKAAGYNQQQQGPSAQELQYQQDIQNAYNDSSNYLNQAGGNAQSALDAAKAEAGSNYDVNAATLGGQQQTAFNTLNQQQTQGTNTYQNALADARRMYQEQQMGAQQRFGGSSSAGQAASEIQAREQARQFGQTNRQYTDLVNNINTQHASVERDYNTQLLQLQQSKQAAIAGATQDFNQKLLSISNNRAQLSQAKADASLQALQNLRNQVFAIEQQNTQFQQALALQKQQAQLGLGRYANQALGYTQQVTQPTYQQPSQQTAATGGLGQSVQNPYAGYTGSVGNNKQNPQYTGAIGLPGVNYKTDQYGNPIYGPAY